METQPGAILNMVWTSDGSGCIGTASDEGSVCVWNSGVSLASYMRCCGLTDALR